MRAPLRLVAPWPILIPTGVLFIAFAGLFHLGQAWDDPRARTFAGFILIAAALLGLYRAWAFHPEYRSGYARWLATTPWDVSRPLPFGPIDLDWPDALPLGGLILAYAFVPGHESARVLGVFLAAHCLALIPAVWRAAKHVPAYATLFGLGLMVRLWPHAWAFAGTGVVVYLIVYDGLRIALRDFPRGSKAENLAAGRGAFDPAKARCGWPYDRLLKDPEKVPEGVREPADDPGVRPAAWVLPSRSSPSQSLLDDLMASLLLGWWLSCLGSNMDRLEFGSLLVTLTVSTPLIAVLIRLAVYGLGYASPMSVWGRIRTGLWVIPGYDVMFVGLALIIVAPVVVVAAGRAWGVPWSITGSIAPAATLFVALATPPGLRRWRLVGRHRMTRRGEETTGDFS
ncbi:hypothetical protein [Paludisphaera soli]|uniref:hypothetical protein n=1 Tax=Paludisphaera soli TaxID=2712865 RepID=UPI0013EB00CF|nr:hypothetical protein [Paludisphaera soli]